MMSSGSDISGTRVALRGVERMATAVDGVSTKIVHSMLVRGDVNSLLLWLPTAVMHTFNMHPRMRALQVAGEKFMAEIQSPLTLESVSSENLLRVRMLTPDEYGEGSPTSWQKFAESECSVGFDRYSELPFYLTAWAAKRKDTARLMLFSDQYMSDGYSGPVVLNHILDQVSLLAKHSQPTTLNSTRPGRSPQPKEFPLRPSLYRMWLKKATWAKPLLKGTNSLFGRRMFRGSVQKFTPVLPARNDQRDFTVPPVANGTSALFADGDPTCMRGALARCQKECVSLDGALVAAVLLALYHTRPSGKQRTGSRYNPFKITAGLDYNMRQHITAKAEEDQVGMYSATADLDWLATEGVDIQTTGFWDLAGRANREVDANLTHTLTMALPTVAADQKINSQMEPSFLKSVRVPHSLTSDVEISNLGSYPFKTTYDLSTSSSDADKSPGMLKFNIYRQLARAMGDGREPKAVQPRGEPVHDKYQQVAARKDHCDSSKKSFSGFSVESLHMYKSTPHLSASAKVFVTAVNGFNYAMAHKCEASVGGALFAALVELCESIGDIGPDEPLVDVLRRLD